MAAFLSTGVIGAFVWLCDHLTGNDGNISFLATLIGGAIMFLAYAPVAVALAGDSDQPGALGVAAIGVFFPVWGWAFGYLICIGGPWGFPQGWMTAAFMYIVWRSWGVSLLIAVIAPAIAGLWNALYSTGIAPTEYQLPEGAIAWNVLTAATLLPYALRRRKRLELWLHRRRCIACGYDISDLSERNCPECGRSL